jgi:hypothetical protein
MAQQRFLSLIDDLDGGKATETVVFGLDGASFEIDLSKKNAAALREGLTEFVEHGRRVKVGAPRSARRTLKRSAGDGPARLSSGNGLSGRASRCRPVAGSPPTWSPDTRRPTPDQRERQVSLTLKRSVLSIKRPPFSAGLSAIGGLHETNGVFAVRVPG